MDGAGAAVDGDQLPVAESACGIPGGDYSGDAVLAGDQGGVGGQGAAVGDDRDRAGEQRRPGGGGGPGDQHLTGLEAAKVCRSILEEASSFEPGVSIFLLVVGAILAFAVDVTTSGFNINTVGVILMVAGALGLVLSLLFWSSFSPYRRSRTVAGPDTVVEERRIERDLP